MPVFAPEDERAHLVELRRMKSRALIRLRRRLVFHAKSCSILTARTSSPVHDVGCESCGGICGEFAVRERNDSQSATEGSGHRPTLWPVQGRA